MRSGPQLDLPYAITVNNLESLVNGLLKQQDEKLPYSFFINDSRLIEDLGTHLQKHKVAPVTLRACRSNVF